MYDLASIIIKIIVFVISLTIHEFAHAWTAKKLGDYTATSEGRLSLNPLAHIDIVGAILAITAGFGWGKPVPVNEYNFKKPVRDSALVSLAGPSSNLLLALLVSIIFRVLNLEDSASGLLFLLFNSIIISNISLFAFNLIPLPPLDGYRIMRLILPKGNLRYYWEQLEKYSTYILLIFLFPLSPLSALTGVYLFTVVKFIYKIFTGSSI